MWGAGEERSGMHAGNRQLLPAQRKHLRIHCLDGSVVEFYPGLNAVRRWRDGI